VRKNKPGKQSTCGNQNLEGGAGRDHRTKLDAQSSVTASLPFRSVVHGRCHASRYRFRAPARVFLGRSSSSSPWPSCLYPTVDICWCGYIKRVACSSAWGSFCTVSTDNTLRFFLGADLALVPLAWSLQSPGSPRARRRGSSP
jgi:hypothetical protein